MLLYILRVFTFTTKNTVMTDRVHVTSGPKAFIFAPRLNWM